MGRMIDMIIPASSVITHLITQLRSKTMTDNLKTRIAEAIGFIIGNTQINDGRMPDYEDIAQEVLDIVEPMIQKWHDIKDAPKHEIDYGHDGVHTVRILAYDHQWACTGAVVAYWDVDHWQVDGRDYATTHFKPTNFQYLSTPTEKE
jgi:hypothetical protein